METKGQPLPPQVQKMLAPLFRLFEHLPRDGNPELTILKGHLLVEEQLYALVRKGVAHPEFVPKLQFKSMIGVARAVSSQAETEWIWRACDALNALRNCLSHDLDRKDFPAKQEKFISTVEQAKGAPDAVDTTPKFTRFHWALLQLHSALAGETHFDFSHLRIPTVLQGGEGAR
jgi:hypothetical protein